MPTIATKKAAPKRPGVKSKRSLEREQLVFYGVALGCALTLIAHLAVQIGFAVKGGNARERNEIGLADLRLMEVAEADAAYAQELKIVTQAKTEDLAAKRRAEEFERRLNFDPQFAVSQKEKDLLEMRKISADATLTVTDAMTRIARLASPPKSEVRVAESVNGSAVEVIFLAGEVSKANEKRLGNKLPEMYYSVRMTAADIVKDLFIFGAARGVTRVVVKCQDEVIINTPQGQKRQPSDFFVVTAQAASAPDWSRVLREDVTRAWVVEKDDYAPLLRAR